MSSAASARSKIDEPVASSRVPPSRPAVSSGVPPSRPAVSVASVVPLLPAWRVDRVFDYLVPDEIGPVGIGTLVRVPFGGRNVRAVVMSVTEVVPDRDLHPLGKVLLDEPVVPPPLDELARWVAERYAVPVGKAVQRFVPPRVRIARREPRPLEGGPASEILSGYDNGSALIASIVRGDAATWCVNALPSHDRGTLISEIVAAAGRGGGSALVVVPEVRFGSQVLDELGKTWPDLVRVDSARTDKERAEAWLQLARGHGVGGGGRSTVFAPAPNLRVLVVDEEHHRTLKEDRSPRYDARRVAIERARLQRAVCVLVSGSPTVETGGAAAAGEFGWVEARPSARRAARPVIEIVGSPTDGDVSQSLFARIRDALREGIDVGLLAPRRGYARVVWCASCRRSVRCPRCEAALAFDRGRSRVRCPRCGFSATPPEQCPACGAADFRYIGAGSERLAEQLARSFPRARVQRMDPEALEATGPALDPTDIYVTTWIGTKTTLRPPARLVAVLDADALIRRADFRAAELGFQALTEMARWAGPADQGGRLVVQTTEPGHHALQAVVRADPRYFLEREIELRRELSYPPFAELVRIAGPQQAVDTVAAAARDEGATVLGPVELRGRQATGYELLAKVPDATRLMEALRPLLRGVQGAGLRIDADPR